MYKQVANYDCLTYFIAHQQFQLHRIDPTAFEHLVTTVLHHIYKRPFYVYKEGRDGGTDAKASNIGTSTNEKIIVQIKHTSDVSAKLTPGKRRSVFEKEKPNVEKLVRHGKLETYIIVTNYPLPAGQADDLEEFFKTAGPEKVEVVGYETLCNWMSDLPNLEKMLCDYPVIKPFESGPSPPKRPKSEPDIKGMIS